MNPSNTTELITQIISNPIFANDIYNYINNIKPKLDNLTTKTAILDEIYNKLNEQPNVQISEYKELLKKFRNKYDKLKEEYTKKNSAIDALKTELNEIKNKMNDYSNKEIMIDSLKKEISQLKLVCADKDNINGNLISQIDNIKLNPIKQLCTECPIKDKLISTLELKEKTTCAECFLKDKIINNLESKVVTECAECKIKSNILNTCEECNKKNIIIKEISEQINKPCVNCEDKDKQIYKLSKRNDKTCKDKDENIKLLQEELTILEKKSIESAEELIRIMTLYKKEKEEREPQNVLEELSKQFGNFITITKR
jgi:uncharacterized protein YukE